jgi:hypothetical protein
VSKLFLGAYSPKSLDIWRATAWVLMALYLVGRCVRVGGCSLVVVCACALVHVCVAACARVSERVRVSGAPRHQSSPRCRVDSVVMRRACVVVWASFGESTR